ncbi:MAG: hypothetical protein JWM74_4688, partial [Myxococcaceae bacterium]|nr:hypothetical protein [Myxococcaceae bacterium]
MHVATRRAERIPAPESPESPTIAPVQERSWAAIALVAVPMLVLLLLVVNQSGLGLPGAADLCRLASQAPGTKVTIAMVGFSAFILVAVALWMRAQRADGRAMRSPLWLLLCVVPGVLAGFVASRFIAAHPTDSLGEIEVGA